jgi:hypothetical protein
MNKTLAAVLLFGTAGVGSVLAQSANTLSSTAPASAVIEVWSMGMSKIILQHPQG